MKNSQLKTYFLKTKDLNTKKKYPVLKIDEKNIDNWMDLKGEDVQNYIDID